MSGQEISLRSVGDLRTDSSGEPLRFFIAAYQRGYRWSPLQVTQLLEDIHEFVHRQREPEEFYCLQPLVVKSRADGSYEVVDGQQRLTTLLLLLRHFNERLAAKYQQPTFTLAYETRSGLDGFLTKPTEAAADDNADFFHLYLAIGAIERWFEAHDTEVEDIKSAILNKAKVIWYQLAPRDNPVAAFTRLNVGKIPLTNDELIRALFLRQEGPDEEEGLTVQLGIAHEWDQMEKDLQSDAFWYFLSNQRDRAQNRIGFIFESVAQAEGLAIGDERDAYWIFYAFNERFRVGGATPESEWRTIKRTYLTLQEWFEDRVLYHMVGFLAGEGMPINEIQALSQHCTKTAFEQRLRREIYRRAIGEDFPDPPNEQLIRDQVTTRVTTLTYKAGSQPIRSLLLLFNIATLLQNSRSNMRFQFDAYKRENWDIEHVRSVSDDKPDRHHERRSWLERCLGYLQTQPAASALCEHIQAFLKLGQNDATYEVFDPLYQKILEHFGEGTSYEAEHGIGNLALLDDSTNRGYKNAVYAIKRKQILELDQGGIFVPLCTRNVFLKVYSQDGDNLMFWSKSDQDGYERAIINVLVNFFCNKMDGVQ